jgi:hypothetical protein
LASFGAKNPASRPGFSRCSFAISLRFGNTLSLVFIALTVSAGISGRVQHHLTENQAQVGFSYKFDSLAPAPVVAKY